jgi:hypothetical protein
MTKKPGWQGVQGRFADVQPGSMAVKQVIAAVPFDLYHPYVGY